MPRRSLSHALQEAAKALLFIALVILGLLLLSTPIAHWVMEGCSRQDRARLDLLNLEKAFELYVQRTGRLPSREEGLQALVEAGVLEKLPVDPWGNPYAFSIAEDGHAEVSTLGVDGVTGGDGSDEDLVRRFRLSVPTR
ncbi:type II secretion system protein GspG [Pyxidicoccus sp. MSG2]|uniref:type II secretion system protein GspG n=1 Tax=Pyxidicoccus sp. MSG2 TaxID=2996790 RepID=UPI00226EA7FA|nr:type II secretion system protein GspG [Pyxidicoccus sp. MSG2]MCY1017784.1 type II secretion system protein GspG [Pyxidicoccus sp. MSG2]